MDFVGMDAVLGSGEEDMATYSALRAINTVPVEFGKPASCRYVTKSLG